MTLKQWILDTSGISKKSLDTYQTPDVHLATCQTFTMDSFCKFFHFIKDILSWEGPHAFDLADVSYYKRGRLSLTKIFESCECFRNVWLSW